MQLFSYTLAVDDGAAPNPYGGVCTLTICKPVIRRTANIGDWVVGLGPTSAPSGQDLSHHVIYAMRVSRKLSYADYDVHCRRQLTAKLPHWSPDVPFEHTVGDCLYEPLADGTFRQRRGVHKHSNFDVDVGGLNALLAEEVFFYFGDQPVRLRQDFDCVRHPFQGHKVHANNACKENFVAWMLNGFGEDRRPRILYGKPLHQHLVLPDTDHATWEICGRRRVVKPSDEEASVC